MTAEQTREGPINCPRFNFNGVQVFATSTEVTILCTSQVIGVGGAGDVQLGSVPTVQLSVSPAVAKEMIAVLQHIVTEHEQTYGELVTEFLQSRKPE